MIESPRPLTRYTLYHDLADCAHSLDVPFAAEITHRSIAVLAGLLPSSWIGLRTTSRPVGRRDLDLRLVCRDRTDVPGLLRASGALPAADPPVAQFVDEVAETFSPRRGVDVSVQHGIEKLWACLPAAVPLPAVNLLPSIPGSARSHASHLSGHGIDEIALIAINFPQRSINLYSSIFSPGHLSRDQVARLIGDLNFPVPDASHLCRNTEAFNCYHTFSWDSPRAQRLCFPIRYSADEFPSHLDQTLHTFVAKAPFLRSDRNFIFYNTYDRDGGYYKVQADYTGTHRETFANTHRPVGEHP